MWYFTQQIRLLIKISVLLALLFSGQSALSQPDSAPGRYLPGGVWQPRNMQATLPEPTPGMAAQENAPDSREEIQVKN
jgi:hypothetical protein